MFCPELEKVKSDVVSFLFLMFFFFYLVSYYEITTAQRLPSAFLLVSTCSSCLVSKTPVTEVPAAPLVFLGRQWIPTFPVLLPTLRKHRDEAGVQLIALGAFIKLEIKLS